MLLQSNYCDLAAILYTAAGHFIFHHNASNKLAERVTKGEDHIPMQSGNEAKVRLTYVCDAQVIWLASLPVLSHILGMRTKKRGLGMRQS